MDTDNKDNSIVDITVPRHIGFVVDGNRRWAKENGVTTKAGHKKGLDVLIDMAYVAREKKIPFVSAYIFSTENWQRSSEEVSNLMELFMFAFRHKLKKLVRDNFRIIFLGRRDHVSAEILSEIADTEAQSQNNTGSTLALCFNYGGRAEILDAAKHLAADILAGKTKLADFSESDFTKYLYHPELPDVDLLVRTSGEQRISGFQLWRMAYSELLFLDKKWPDITASDMDDILTEYAHRHRRFGK